MKNHILSFLKGSFKLVVTGTIAFFIAIVASDNSNIVYKTLDDHDITDQVAQKAILSAMIAFIIGFLDLLLKLLFKLFLWIVGKYFKRLKVSINFKENNRNKKSIKFKPSNGVYKEERIDIEVEVIPEGKISLLILKLLGLQIQVFFNPHILDVTLENDQDWLGEKPVTIIDDKQAVCISVLKNYNIQGSKLKPFKTTESIVIFPKRVKRDTAHIDFRLSSFFGSKLSSALCDSDMKDLDIECERG